MGIKKVSNGKLAGVLVAILILIAGSWLVWHAHRSNLKSALLKPTANTGLIISRNGSDQLIPMTVGGKDENVAMRPFRITTSHAQAAAILDDIRSLEQAPHGGTYYCPIDWGIEYTLIFSDPSVTATADWSGCRWLSIGGNSYWTSDRFWKEVQVATHQPA